MEVINTDISDVKLVEPLVIEDSRGYFFESFNQKKIETELQITETFVQDNESRSTKEVLRGLHFQLPPYAQDKLVRVIEGHIFDVAVDIRRSSPTFCRWVGVNLSHENKKQLWVPKGFAHGFLVLSEYADVLYKSTQYYNPEFDRVIHWADPRLDISWPLIGKPILSLRDNEAPQLNSVELFP